MLSLHFLSLQDVLLYAGMGLDNCLYFICLYFQNCLFIKAKILNAFLKKAISNNSFINVYVYAFIALLLPLKFKFIKNL